MPVNLDKYMNCLDFRIHGSLLLAYFEGLFAIDSLIAKQDQTYYIANKAPRSMIANFVRNALTKVYCNFWEGNDANSWR